MSLLYGNAVELGIGYCRSGNFHCYIFDLPTKIMNTLMVKIAYLEMKNKNYRIPVKIFESTVVSKC